PNLEKFAIRPVRVCWLPREAWPIESTLLAAYCRRGWQLVPGNSAASLSTHRQGLNLLLDTTGTKSHLVTRGHLPEARRHA
ncbi:hypothetical protein, partial [Salmonella sp. SAL4443]|uniref:hypothetical protein n=1 Tax=Salmonella sp. SAL4443 TaxID=3159898 RepID=UPI003979B749